MNSEPRPQSIGSGGQMQDQTTFPQAQRQLSRQSRGSINESCMMEDVEDTGAPKVNKIPPPQQSKQMISKSSNEENLLEEDEKENFQDFNKMETSKQMRLRKVSSYISQNSQRHANSVSLDYKLDQELFTLQKLKDPVNACLICGEVLDLALMESRAGLRRLECWREHVVCDDCLISYITIKVQDANVLGIPCPCKSVKVDSCPNEYGQEQIVRILSDSDDLGGIEDCLRSDYDTELGIPLLVKQYKNLDVIFKYKKFLFNQHIESNPNCRWCPECSKTRSQTIVRKSIHLKVNSMVMGLGENLVLEKVPTEEEKLIQQVTELREELMEQSKQIITNQGYELKLSKLSKKHREGSSASMDSMQIQKEIQKKANSCFTRTNPHYGQCQRCQYEICMKCGLPYHRQKNCKSQLDVAMKEYFQNLSVKNTVTNCPQCGLIVEKEEGGCNHMICSKCQYQFCWICGMKYEVDHFDRSNVFGCQGLQQRAPQNRCHLVCSTICHLFTIPFTLLFYPVYVLMAAYRNPYHMPQRWRWLCCCNAVAQRYNNCCCTCWLFLLGLPFVLAVGLIIGCLNLAIKLVPAILFKLWKLMVMVCCWRCSCCLNRHKG